MHPGAVITEIVGVNMDMPDADERFIEDMPPWVKAEMLAVPEGEARIAAMKAKASQMFNRFGLRAVSTRARSPSDLPRVPGGMRACGGSTVFSPCFLSFFFWGQNNDRPVAN